MLCLHAHISRHKRNEKEHRLFLTKQRSDWFFGVLFFFNRACILFTTSMGTMHMHTSCHRLEHVRQKCDKDMYMYIQQNGKLDDCDPCAIFIFFLVYVSVYMHVEEHVGKIGVVHA